MWVDVIHNNLPRFGLTWCFDSRVEGYCWVGFQAGYREFVLAWGYP